MIAAADRLDLPELERRLGLQHARAHGGSGSDPRRHARWEHGRTSVASEPKAPRAATGLVAAHLLHGAHEVTLFEAADRVGGHAHTVDVEIEGRRHAVDTGFIVYNEHTYPLFTALLARLGVEN